MELRLLQTTDLDDVVGTFQRAFADYIVKLHLDRDALLKMMTRRGADLSLSAGAFENAEMKAVMVVALDHFDGAITAYDVFTGVVPDARGQGLAARLFDVAIPACLQRGAHRFLLEVIEDNEPAVRTYRKMGFNQRRRLRIFTLEGPCCADDQRPSQRNSHRRCADCRTDKNGRAQLAKRRCIHPASEG